MSFYEYFEQWFEDNHTKVHTFTINAFDGKVSRKIYTDMINYDEFNIVRHYHPEGIYYEINRGDSYMDKKIGSINDSGLNFEYKPWFGISNVENLEVYIVDRKIERKDLDKKVKDWFDSVLLTYELFNELKTNNKIEKRVKL
jgi:hypothetical protein